MKQIKNFTIFRGKDMIINNVINIFRGQNIRDFSGSKNSAFNAFRGENIMDLK